MQQELAEYFRNPLIEPGLLLAEAPTGYGKHTKRYRQFTPI